MLAMVGIPYLVRVQCVGVGRIRSVSRCLRCDNISEGNTDLFVVAFQVGFRKTALLGIISPEDAGSPVGRPFITCDTHHLPFPGGIDT
jgi:hypothetical protein